jgi:hypothetical protein
MVPAYIFMAIAVLPKYAIFLVLKEKNTIKFTIKFYGDIYQLIINKGKFLADAMVTLPFG